jgi:hypothetical protein
MENDKTWPDAYGTCEKCDSIKTHDNHKKCACCDREYCDKCCDGTCKCMDEQEARCESCEELVSVFDLIRCKECGTYRCGKCSLKECSCSTDFISRLQQVIHEQNVIINAMRESGMKIMQLVTNSSSVLDHAVVENYIKYLKTEIQKLEEENLHLRKAMIAIARSSDEQK